MEAIYVDGSLLKSANEEVSNVNTTQVIGLVAAFCKPLPINLFVVVDGKHESAEDYFNQVNCGFQIPQSRFDFVMVFCAVFWFYDKFKVGFIFKNFI